MSDISLPQSWSDWTLEELLGAGTYGSVYKAVNDSGDICAIKVIDVPQTESEASSIQKTYKDPESLTHYINGLVTDFEKEIEMMDHLKGSQHIVSIYDYQKEPRGIGYRLFIRMEYLNNFVEYCENEEITEEKLIAFALDLCQGLIECEKYNIIHRDIKPDNILIDNKGRLKLCDFGLARKLDISECTMSLKGTFSYMAPEIILTKHYNKQADIYSLGMILYRMMNRGREPFIPLEKRFLLPKDKEAALNQRVSGTPLPPPADASESFSDIILKACAFKPEDRYKTPTQFKKDLLRLQKGNYRKQLLSNTQIKRLIIACISGAILGCAGTAYVWNSYFHGVNVHRRDDTITITGNGVIKQTDVAKYNNVKHIKIKNGIIGIGKNAFKEFTSLEKVSIPSSVTYAEEAAFKNCSSLTDIEGSEHLQELGREAFTECYSLTSFQPSEALKEIPENCFQYTGISSFDFSYVDSCGANAFNGCESLSELIHEEHLESIQDNCFYSCPNLDEFDLGPNVKKIEHDTFAECVSLSRVNLGENITELGDGAFTNCLNLATINGIDHVTSFGDFCLEDTVWMEAEREKQEFVSINHVLLRYGNTKKKSATIPEDITTIGPSAFYDCSQLEKIIIPSSVTRIGMSAFSNCNNADLIFENPSSITEIGADALYETKWFKQQTEEFVSLNGILLAYNGNDENVIIPDGITAISGSCFNEHSKVEVQSITVSSAVDVTEVDGEVIKIKIR